LVISELDFTIRNILRGPHKLLLDGRHLPQKNMLRVCPLEDVYVCVRPATIVQSHMTTFQHEDSMEILKTIIGLCFSTERTDQWREFLVDKEEDFKGEGSELSHAQFQIYRDFIFLIEGTLHEKCLDYGLELADFFDLCRSHDDLPAVDVFNTIITIAASPEMFFEMMRDAPKREYMFGVIKSWRMYFSEKK
jgi:hypothetical protein